MIEVRFTGATAAEVALEMKAFVAGLTGNTEAATPLKSIKGGAVIDKKPEEKKPDEAKPVINDNVMAAEDIAKERTEIRNLLDARTKKGDIEKAAARKVFSDLKQVPEAKNVTSLLPENFEKVKEGLLKIKI